MYSIGLDIGSVAAKGVLFNGQVVDHMMIPTGWNPRESGRMLHDSLLIRNRISPGDIKSVIATGYGRIALDFISRAVTEITCHARGAHFLYPDTRTILDIGGQDSKVICINTSGNVLDFVMNDKCAAGTGKFLEVTVTSLGVPIHEIDMVTTGVEATRINSMCTVFAESEVVSLLANGVQKESIVKGVIASIAERTATLAGKLKIEDMVLFTGGLSNSRHIIEELSRVLGTEVRVSEQSQYAGAIGAAVMGW